MTDEAIICTWMGWPETMLTAGVPLNRLGLLWAVEERLTDEHWTDYEMRMRAETVHNALPGWTRKVLHATPQQKIAALAAVLRPIVEAKEVPHDAR